MSTAWRPVSEAEATSNMAAFVEWLRATDRLPDASPARVAQRATEEPPAFRAAVRDFLGIGPDLQAALARADQGRLAQYSGPLLQAVRASDHPAVARWRRGDGWEHLVGCVAGHLLAAETRAGDRLFWVGKTDEPWPIAGLLLGAEIILGSVAAHDHGATATWSAPLFYPAQAASFRSG